MSEAGTMALELRLKDRALARLEDQVQQYQAALAEARLRPQDAQAPQDQAVPEPPEVPAEPQPAGEDTPAE